MDSLTLQVIESESVNQQIQFKAFQQRIEGGSDKQDDVNDERAKSNMTVLLYQSQIEESITVPDESMDSKSIK